MQCSELWASFGPRRSQISWRSSPGQGEGEGEGEGEAEAEAEAEAEGEGEGEGEGESSRAELPHHALLQRLVPVLDKVLDLVERADTERVARAEELPPCQRLARAILLDRRKASNELWITLQVGEGVPDSGGRRLYHLRRPVKAAVR